MFRDPDNALLPNWKHIPVGYHGRSSSIVISGVDLHRPKGQRMARAPMHRLLVQVSAWILSLNWHSSLAKASLWGTALKLKRRDEYIFGMVLFNDWSARDIQKWEYVPLGPFLGRILDQH